MQLARSPTEPARHSHTLGTAQPLPSVCRAVPYAVDPRSRFASFYSVVVRRRCGWFRHTTTAPRSFVDCLRGSRYGEALRLGEQILEREPENEVGPGQTL